MLPVLYWPDAVQRGARHGVNGNRRNVSQRPNFAKSVVFGPKILYYKKVTDHVIWKYEFKKEINMKTTALIMAGGRGERFWPRSRKSLPKQFLSLTDDGKTMIQLTVERILPLVNMEDIYIATNRDYKELVAEQLSDLPAENILCEPIGRNTAPCIGLGAMHISRKYEDALMIVLPSDHLIKNKSLFIRTLQNACEVAEEGSNLVTLGITPNYPETGYGYIKFDPDQPLKQSYLVDQFVEKPDLDTAEQYLSDGTYLWNSGMFIWKISSILENIKAYLPATFTGLEKIREALYTPMEDQVLLDEFEKFASDSVDYGIMEKADHIYTLPGNFGWDDVGSWLAVERIKKTDDDNNVMNGNVVAYETRDCIIEGSGKLIATVGIDNLIIVDTADATLICDKTSAGDIKKVLQTLRESNKTEYL